ncbi:Hint domain-containing protein [Nonomuraea sp. NPDC001636]|uniref:Hint domain-containing protein n=1 Tax=Nonomuraea sp. NPDC001636 TaxID=3154391 RepID=UPI00332E0FC3
MGRRQRLHHHRHRLRRHLPLTRHQITIPATEGALAGTYQFATGYKTDGSVATTTMPAAGGLPSEMLLDALVEGGIGALTGGLMSVGGAALKAGAAALKEGVKEAGQAAMKAATQEIADIFTGKITSGLMSNASKSAAACLANSFTPGKAVLMANGSTKAIAGIKPGDKVKATDPETGKTGPRRVIATISGQGEKNLLEITVAVGGHTGNKASHVVATGL